MDRNAVLTKLYNSEELKRTISNLVPFELQPDLKQELFLLLCELPENEFKLLIEGGFLKGYIIKTIRNMAHSKRSTFAKKYKSLKSLSETEPIADKESEGYPLDLICALVDGLHFYERDIIKAYADLGCNGAAVSRKTNIEIRSVRKAVVRASATVKQRLYEVYY